MLDGHTWSQKRSCDLLCTADSVHYKKPKTTHHDTTLQWLSIYSLKTYRDIKGRKTLRVKTSDFNLTSNQVLVRRLVSQPFQRFPERNQQNTRGVCPGKRLYPPAEGSTVEKCLFVLSPGPDPGLQVAGWSWKIWLLENPLNIWWSWSFGKTNKTKTIINSRIKIGCFFFRWSFRATSGQIQVALLAYQYLVVFHFAYSCFTNATR